MFFLLSIVLFLSVAYVIVSNRKPKKYPPGPDWLPIIGNAHLVKQLSDKLDGKHKAFAHLNKIYDTNLLGLKLGEEKVVIVSSYPLIKEILTRDEFSGRPNNFFIKLRCLGSRNGITMTDGSFSKIQRKFVKSHLRELGFGKELMEQFLRTEITDLLKVLKQKESEELEFYKIIPLSVINTLWVILAGKRLSRDDERLSKLLMIMKERAAFFDLSGGIMNHFPWLRFIAPEAIGYNLIKKLNSELKKLVTDTIDDHKNTWNDGKDDDLIYSYISEMKKNTLETSNFTEEQLVMICIDFFIAGSVSTSTTLDFAFLMMILHPDVQDKVHITLDKAFKPTEEINYRDRYRVPYVEAVLFEVIRYCQVAPIGGPKRAICTTELDGYIIPKDTTVLYSIYSLHNTKEYWQEPEVFRPERFLDENGHLVHHEVFIPFSTGPRRCLGEVLARSCFFTFFCEIIRNYNISVYPGTPKPTDKLYPGWFSSPEKYKAKITRRS